MCRIFVSTAAICFVAGKVCFGVFFVRLLWFIVDFPAVEDGIRMVSRVREL